MLARGLRAGLRGAPLPCARRLLHLSALHGGLRAGLRGALCVLRGGVGRQTVAYAVGWGARQMACWKNGNSSLRGGGRARQMACAASAARAFSSLVGPYFCPETIP